jgi:hypothetical protein
LFFFFFFALISFFFFFCVRFVIGSPANLKLHLSIYDIAVIFFCITAANRAACVVGATHNHFLIFFFFFFFFVFCVAHTMCCAVNSFVLLVVAAAVVSVNAVADLTGDAAKDFTDTRFDATSGRPKNFGVVRVQDGTDSPDVGVPGQFPRGTISGWDIRAIFFQYDDLKDELLIGVDCFGVCGDADGDGDAGSASPTLRSLGGQDLPDLARGEGFAIVLDFDLNVADVLPSFQPTVLAPFDFVIGVPAGQPADAVEVAMPGQVEVLPCTKGKADNDLLNMANCFGVYEYQNTVAVNIARRFLREAIIDGAKWPTRNSNPTPVPARPDLEWTIGRIIDLRARKGAAFNRSNREPWNVLMQAFSGSFLDAGIGEDYLPSQTDYVEVSFPCLELDQCDVCLGDNNTCLDCAGTPNGSCVYDQCDVCCGDNRSCRDCAGTPNGSRVYDVCDVCGGNGSTCRDCRGTPNGSATYDVCDICNGNGSTCLDCRGIPNGPTRYDVCDVCGGDSSTCRDCAGTPNGSRVYDRCDVCGGDSSTCLDCLGLPNGRAVYDVCDVCNGDGVELLRLHWGAERLGALRRVRRVQRRRLDVRRLRRRAERLVRRTTRATCAAATAPPASTAPTRRLARASTTTAACAAATARRASA